MAIYREDVTHAIPYNFDPLIVEALHRFNTMNLTIQFHLVPRTHWQSADILIYREETLLPTKLGYADLPLNGNPGSAIRLHLTNIMDWAVTNEAIVNIICHELGHTMGFHHTDYMDNSYSCGGNPVNEAAIYPEVGFIHIPGTPPGPEPNSWMLACMPVPGIGRPFTANDLIALQFLY